MYQVYNNLISEYLSPLRSKPAVRVHRKEELREHYNNIVNLNRKSPLYIVKPTNVNQKYVLDLKEKSIMLSDRIALFEEQSEDAFAYKKTYSTSSKVKARIVNDDYTQLPDEFDINVTGLATKQVNKGTEYYPDGRGLPPGEYTFIAKVDGNEYEFGFAIKKNAHNIDVMKSLARFVNKSDIGIEAKVVTNKDKKIYLDIRSVQTGTTGERIFTFEDVNSDGNMIGVSSYYGLNNVVHEPTNATFEINGEVASTLTNKVVLNRSVELELSGITEEPVHVGYKNNPDKAFKHVEEIFDIYNSIVSNNDNYKEITGQKSKLNSELDYLLLIHKDTLGDIGINKEDGKYYLDKTKAREAFESGRFQEVMSPEGKILGKLVKKSDDIAINPMEYTNKLMVSYPDYTKKGVGYAYITSMYSGMLFNYYC